MAFATSLDSITPMHVDYSTGNTSQWALGSGLNGIADAIGYPVIVSGRLTYASSYDAGGGVTILPPQGPGFGKIRLNPPLPRPPSTNHGEDRAEGVKWLHNGDLIGREVWHGYAICLPANGIKGPVEFGPHAGQTLANGWLDDWYPQSWTGHAQGPVISQWGASSGEVTCNLININPPSWEGNGAPSLSWFGAGGLSAGGGFQAGASEHRLWVNPNAGNGWNTFTSPWTPDQVGDRYPQIIGPHVQLQQPGGTFNVPFTLNKWHFVKQCWTHGNCDTDNNAYRAWHREHDSGLGWSQTVGSPAWYRNCAYNPSTGYPTTGVWNRPSNMGGYVYWLPQSIEYLHGLIGMAFDEATIDAMFPAVTGTPPTPPASPQSAIWLPEKIHVHSGSAY